MTQQVDMEALVNQLLEENPAVKEAMEVFGMSREQYRAAVEARLGKATLSSNAVTTNPDGDVETDS